VQLCAQSLAISEPGDPQTTL